MFNDLVDLGDDFDFEDRGGVVIGFLFLVVTRELLTLAFMMLIPTLDCDYDLI